MCDFGGEGSKVRAVSLVSPSAPVFSQGSLGNFMFRKKGWWKEMHQNKLCLSGNGAMGMLGIICSVGPFLAVSAQYSFRKQRNWVQLFCCAEAIAVEQTATTSE